MAITVLLILGLLWAAVLLPPFLRSRSENRRGDTFGGLNYRLGPVGRAGPIAAIAPRVAFGSSGPYRPGALPARRVSHRPVTVALPPSSMTPAQRRRRDVLLGLGGVAGLTLLLALLSGVAALWLLHLLADVALGAYVYLLVQYRRRTVQRRASAPPSPPRERPRQVRHQPHAAHRQLTLRRSLPS